MVLGIIAAMNKEADKIISAMTDIKTETVGGIEFTAGKIGSVDVVCSICGIGKVFAAMCAQTMAIRYSPDYIVNTGIGGTLTRELGIGDIAVSSDTVQHDMDTTAMGDPIGLVSGINVIKFPASDILSKKISDIAENHGIKTLRGTIATGDKFVADDKIKEKIVGNFGAIVCEMEGAAVAQVCYVNKIPYCVVRAISDSADGQALEDYPTFSKKAANNSADIVIELAKSFNG